MTEQSTRTNGHNKLAEALAVSARELAGLLGISLRQTWRLNSAGKLPKPIRLGGSVRWDRQEVLDWFKAGCPDRKAWAAQKELEGAR